MVPELAERSLRCYQDDQINFQFSSLPCTYLPLSVKSVFSFSSGLVYPNPSYGSFTIKLKDRSTMVDHVELWDLSGRKVGNAPVDPMQMEIECNFKVPAGIYVLKVAGSQQSYLGRVVIIQ